MADCESNKLLQKHKQIVFFLEQKSINGKIQKEKFGLLDYAKFNMKYTLNIEHNISIIVLH